MTMGLTMSDSTTVNLMTGGCIVQDGYYPKTPGDEDVTVVEEIPVLLIGSGADMLAKIRAIETALELAAASQRNHVYLNFQLDATQTSYRSRVLGGSVVFDGRLDKRWRQGRLAATVLVRRDVVWEGPETQLSVDNRHGSGTSGVPVHWRADSTHDNWVDIDAADIVGTLPGPARVEVTYPSDASYYITELYIHNGWRHPVTTPYHILEAENYTNTDGGTQVTDAAYSGGAYMAISLDAGLAENNVTWVLDEGVSAGSQLRLKGDLGRFLMLARASTTDEVWAWLTLSGAGGSASWSGPRVRLSNLAGFDLVNLGVCEMPPGYRSIGNWYGSLNLVLYTAASGVTVNVDCLMVCPTDSCGYMTWQNVAMDTAKTIVMDAICQRRYLVDPVSSRVFLANGSWGYIYLQPGVDNRLYFNYRRNTTGGDSAGTMTVKVYYRPRRRSL